MNPLTPEILRTGRPDPDPDPIALRAGPLTAEFHPAIGWLRYLRMGDHEVVRAVYVAVRNLDWATVLPTISDLKIDVQKDSFQITFHAVSKNHEIDFSWNTTITGTDQGEVHYEFEGQAGAAFEANRIGLCLLHPLTECAGKPCRVEKTNGTVEERAFPKFIEPQAAFESIHSLTYEPAPGVQANVRFEGDPFHTEDQRNFSDASFKTYSAPSEFPLAMVPGRVIRHQATISLPGQPRRILPILLGGGPQFSIATTPVMTKPPVGLGMATHAQPLTELEVSRLKSLGLSHLRVDLNVDQTGAWQEVLARAAGESTQLGMPLHVALHLGKNPEADLASLAEVLPSLNPNISLWQIFSREKAQASLVQQAKTQLSKEGTKTLFATGSDAWFIELNMNRPHPSETSLPCYPITPQVHAFDNATMVETVAAQPLTVETTRQFAPRSVVISPITLKLRSNPDAKRALSPCPPNALPENVDPRQMSLFGAGWTLASLARLAAFGHLHSLTYFETTGWKGIMETESGSLQPNLFRSVPGGVFPVYHVFADMAGYTKVLPTHSSHPLQTEAMTLLDPKNKKRVLVANLIGRQQEIRVKTGTCKARIRYLDESNAEMAMRDPEAFRELPGEEAESRSAKIALNLKPYALARVDVL